MEELIFNSIKLSELKDILGIMFEAGEVPLIVGPPGIGKSDFIREYGQYIAKVKNREFVEWFDIIGSPKEKEVLNNPSKYFLFVDIKLYEYEPTDVKGLLYIDDVEKVTRTYPWDWMKFFYHPDSMGILFLDEITMADPQTIKVAFQIVYQKVIANRRIKGKILIACAGNPPDYNILAMELPLPFEDRVALYYVYPDFAIWLAWAMKNGIPDVVISFLGIHPQYLFKYDSTADGFRQRRIVTPRTWAKLSKCIKIIEENYKDAKTKIEKIKLIAKGYLPPEIYNKFVSFVEKYYTTDPKFINTIIKDILNNPQILLSLEKDVDTLLLVLNGISSYYAKGSLSLDKYLIILKVLANIRKEWGIYLVFETIKRLKYLNDKAAFESLMKALRENLPDIYDIIIKLSY